MVQLLLSKTERKEKNYKVKIYSFFLILQYLIFFNLIPFAMNQSQDQFNYQLRPNGVQSFFIKYILIRNYIGLRQHYFWSEMVENCRAVFATHCRGHIDI